MGDLIKQLWQRAVTERTKAISSFTKKEKIRLKHELNIIEQTNTAEQIISFINQADEARKIGHFYVKGAANCSFLLYSVKATTIDPMWSGSQFERFINPLMDGTPYYEIAFTAPKTFCAEEEYMPIDDFIKWANSPKIKRGDDKYDYNSDSRRTSQIYHIVSPHESYMDIINGRISTLTLNARSGQIREKPLRR